MSALPAGFPRLYDWRWGLLVAQMAGVADWLIGQGYPIDYTTDDPPPKVLQWAIAEFMWVERDACSQEDFKGDIAEYFTFLASVAHWPEGAG